MDEQIVDVEKPRINWLLVAIFVLILTNLATLGVLGFVILQSNVDIPNTDSGRNYPIEKPTATPTEVITPPDMPIDLLSKNWYEVVVLRNKPGAKITGKLDIMESLVSEFGQPVKIKYVAGFDPYKESSDIYNQPFYFRYERPVDMLASADFILETQIKPVTMEKGNYLDNDKLCLADSDCSPRFEWCSYGAFNKYSIYRPNSGCGSTDYPEEKTMTVNGETTIDGCPVYQVDLKYTGARCVENRCVAVERQFKCNTNQNPIP